VNDRVANWPFSAFSLVGGTQRWIRYGNDLHMLMNGGHYSGAYLYWMRTNYAFLNATAVGPMLIAFNCPVDIRIYESQERLVGKIIDNVAIDIEDSEVFAFVIDDTKHFFLPSGEVFTAKITATGDGIMTYTVEILDVLSDTPTSIRTFENVRLYQGRQMVSEITSVPETLLLFLENGETVGEIIEDGTEIRFCDICKVRLCECPEANLYIRAVNIDENNGWIEIRNPTNRVLSARGMFLSNDDSELFMWQLPAIIIRQGESVRVRTESSNFSPVHKRMTANFDVVGSEILRLTCFTGNVLYEFEVA